jgi:hypothetical protein
LDCFRSFAGQREKPTLREDSSRSPNRRTFLACQIDEFI